MWKRDVEKRCRKETCRVLPDPQWAYKKDLKRDLGQRPVKKTYKKTKENKE